MKTEEFLDVVDESGKPTGKTVSRGEAHENGIRHRTSQIWIVRPGGKGFDILLQKRSDNKESFPGMYDTSSAGHVPAGDEPLQSALRELSEELGMEARPEDLQLVGSFSLRYEKEFYGQIYRDNHITTTYVYNKPVDIDCLTLQESEVSEVRWFDLEEVWNEIQYSRKRFCMSTEGLKLLRDYLNKTTN